VWTPRARARVEAWAAHPRATAESRECALAPLFERAFAAHERGHGPSRFDAATVELSLLRTLLAARDAPDGGVVLRCVGTHVRVAAAPPPHASADDGQFTNAAARPSGDDPKARRTASAGDASELQLHALSSLLDAIDDDADDADAACRAPLPRRSSAVGPMLPPPPRNTDDMLARLQLLLSEESGDGGGNDDRSAHAPAPFSRDDAAALLTARRAALRAAGACLLMAAAHARFVDDENGEGASEEESEHGHEDARVEARFARAAHDALHAPPTARQLTQAAWAVAPPWLTRSGGGDEHAFPSGKNEAARLQPAMARLSMWAHSGALRYAAAAAAAQEGAPAGVAHANELTAFLLHQAFFGNPHLLHEAAGRGVAPACGLHPAQPGTARGAAAWMAAHRHAAEARAAERYAHRCNDADDAAEEQQQEEEDNTTEHGCWAGAAARRVARAFLDAPFCADTPLHAAGAAMAAAARAAGAAAYARGQFALAAECFSYALAVLPWRSGAPGGADDARAAALLSSRAQCALSARMLPAAEADATASLALRPGHAVTLLRRARARAEQGFATADADLAAARVAAQNEGAPA
jgi:hypothetical protein